MPLSPSPPPMQPLAPAVRTVWTIKMILFWAVLWAVSLVYDAAAFFTADEGILPAGAATVLVLALGSALSYFVPRLRYRFWRYELLTHELHLERGIVNRVRTIVPLRRIQHLDVSQDLLEREFDLGRLVVHTAGTRSSDVVLPGLYLAEAEQLRDRVKRYILEDRLEDRV